MSRPTNAEILAELDSVAPYSERQARHDDWLRALVAEVEAKDALIETMFDGLCEMYSYGQCRCGHAACKRCKSTKFADEVFDDYRAAKAAND